MPFDPSLTEGVVAPHSKFFSGAPSPKQTIKQMNKQKMTKASDLSNILRGHFDEKRGYHFPRDWDKPSRTSE